MFPPSRFSIRKYGVKDKYSLLNKGLFPEVLPPAFISSDIKRALRGLVPATRAKAFHKRSADYIRYNGTKHDGSRRYFGTPNPITYFYVSEFVHANWTSFEQRFQSSPFSVSTPRVAKETDDRAIIIPSLSELTVEASRKIGHSEFILRADIAQFFPSIYTHSISWSAHGLAEAKADTSDASITNLFNRLDLFARNCQQAETRGVLVGPDAFRLIAEFIISGLDKDLNESVGQYIVGAARHVDDYYVGLRSEADALIVLSALREILQRYSLNLNDAKTKILSGLEPLNEVWAQELRRDARRLKAIFIASDDAVILINKATELARTLGSDSPIKIALRALDQARAYQEDIWSVVEPYLQRIALRHAHCLDYICLLVVKRFSIGLQIDADGWKETMHTIISRQLPLSHHHEIVWSVWLLICCKLDLNEELVAAVAQNPNAHARALLVQGFTEGVIPRKPKLRFGNRLASGDSAWLLNLVARSTGFTKAPFGGDFAPEFEHLASRKVKLIDINAHVLAVKERKTRAISRTRYGYDNDDDDDDDAPWRWLGRDHDVPTLEL